MTIKRFDMLQAFKVTQLKKKILSLESRSYIDTEEEQGSI